MKFKGKIDLWFWIVMLAGDVMLVFSFLDAKRIGIVGLLIFVIYNLLFLPFVFRNYVEITEDKLFVIFGFSKDSISLSEITEVYGTHNPIASSAASLDRIVIAGRNKQLMCAVRDKDEFFYYLKEKNPKIEIGEKSAHKESKLEKRVIIFTLFIFIAVGVVLITGDINISYGEESFTIEANYWNDMEVEYAEIESIEYRDEKISGSRTAGFGSYRLLMGTFENDEFGYYERYTYKNCDAGVVLVVNGKELVISGKNKESTKEIYQKLCNIIQK